MSSPASASPACIDLHRSLAREFNLLADLENRINRKNAIKKIADGLTNMIERANGKKKVGQTVVKPALIFSAKAAAAAAAAAPPTPTPAAAEKAEEIDTTPITQERKEAVEILYHLLFLPTTVSSTVTLLSLLLSRISDEVEAVRSGSIQLSIDLIHAIGSHVTPSLLPEFLPLLHARLAPSAASLSAASSFAASSSSSSSVGIASIQSGLAIPTSALPVSNATSTGAATAGGHLESSEELRLKLLHLLRELVAAEECRSAIAKANNSADADASSPLDNSMDKVCSILLRTLADPYPDLKKDSCLLSMMVARQLAKSRSLSNLARNEFTTSLQKALVGCLKHQHSSVRVCALQAFGSLVLVVNGSNLSQGTMESFPILVACLTDRTPRVREVLISELTAWLSSLRDLCAADQSRLLALLLQSHADELPAIAAKAVQAMEQVAKQIEDNTRMVDSDATANAASDGTFLTGVAVESTIAAATPPADQPWTLTPALATPFSARPSPAVRALVRAHLSQLLPEILTDLSDWTQSKRLRAAGTLKALIVSVEDEIVLHLPQVLTSLVKNIRDEDSSIHLLLSQVGEVIGSVVVDSKVWMEHLLREIEKNHDAQYRSSVLIVLGNCVKGMPIKINQTAPVATSSPSSSSDASSFSTLNSLFPYLLQTLSHPDIGCSDDLSIRLQLHKILSCVLSRLPRECGESNQFSQRIFHMLMQLDTKGVGGTSMAVGTTNNNTGASVVQIEEERQLLTSLELLARCELQYGNLQLSPSSSSSSSSPSSSALLSAVFSRHFLPELTTLFSSDLLDNPRGTALILGPEWAVNKSGPDMMKLLTCIQLLERAIGLVALELKEGRGPGEGASLSTCAALLDQHLPTILPILVHSARPECDSVPRSLVLTWIYKLVLLNRQAGILKPTDTEVVQMIVGDMIVPNCVWRSGRVASSIRLHGLTVLHAICVGGLMSKSLALQVAPGVFPILKTNLDDDDPKMRMLVLLIFQFWLELLPSHSIRMEEDALTELHRELLKRLDDSHDDIRLEVVKAFSLLFHKVFPPASDYDKTDSYFRYILSSFFIYLDDANPKIIQACFDFLQTTIDYNRRVFMQETEAAKKKQTTGRYCDQLMQLAAAKTQAEPSSQ